jgi:hypothetical protein
VIGHTETLSGSGQWGHVLSVTSIISPAMPLLHHDVLSAFMMPTPLAATVFYRVASSGPAGWGLVLIVAACKAPPCTSFVAPGGLWAPARALRCDIGETHICSFGWSRVADGATGTDSVAHF